MTTVFAPDGRSIPVTVIQAGPCVVTQIKTEAIDGYNALQLSYSEKREARVTKPLRGHFKKAGVACYAVAKEFEVDQPADFALGQTVNTELFQVGEKVDVVGKTKGRGYSGVIKRHGFHGGKNTHGSHSHRVPGSIGCSAWPAKVIKGKKMPGRYGTDRKTVRNLEIVDIRPEQNLILIKGALPGPNSGIVEIKKLKFQ